MKKIIQQIVLVAFVAIAGAIYTYFSHGVTSPFMSYAFLWLLLGFVLQHVISPRLPRKVKKGIKSLHYSLRLSYMLNATLGSISVGIIYIAGSYTDLLYAQLVVGLISLLLYLILSIVLMWATR